jgi:DNA-directed RNA polymerase specialized sigma24 family protein
LFSLDRATGCAKNAVNLGVGVTVFRGRLHRVVEVMMGTGSLTELFQDVPFEDLAAALRTGERLQGWSIVFERIVARVGAAVRRRFPGAPFADDAVQSACRTFFRRVREGRFDLEGPEALVGLLVGIAYRKALVQHRQLARGSMPLNSRDDVDAASTDANPEAIDRLREAMDRQLADMLGQVEESLTDGFHRDILPHWFDKEYRGKKITKQQIAHAVGCSLSTVERVIVELRTKWQPLVEEGRRAIRELACDLDQ